MLKNHSIAFESFDRMFPNQDEIPKGGYGNLIALPLQGKAVKEKHSVFVDENFLPYEDQWKYLSSVQKLSKIKITEISKLIKNSDEFFQEENFSDNKKSTNFSAEKTQIKKEKLEPSDFSKTVKFL